MSMRKITGFSKKEETPPKFLDILMKIKPLDSAY